MHSWCPEFAGTEHYEEYSGASEFILTTRHFTGSLLRSASVSKALTVRYWDTAGVLFRIPENEYPTDQKKKPDESPCIQI